MRALRERLSGQSKKGLFFERLVFWPLIKGLITPDEKLEFGGFFPKHSR
jgi:hypothetical protein